MSEKTRTVSFGEITLDNLRSHIDFWFIAQTDGLLRFGMYQHPPGMEQNEIKGHITDINHIITLRDMLNVAIEYAQEQEKTSALETD